MNEFYSKERLEDESHAVTMFWNAGKLVWAPDWAMGVRCGPWVLCNEIRIVVNVEY